MKRLSKYGAVPTVVDGVRFASKAEAKRDFELTILQRKGEISQLERQPRWPIIVNRVKVCTYVGDWQYVEGGKCVVEDKKGVRTREFKLKWRLCKACFPQIEWRLS